MFFQCQIANFVTVVVVVVAALMDVMVGCGQGGGLVRWIDPHTMDANQTERAVRGTQSLAGDEEPRRFPKKTVFRDESKQLRSTRNDRLARLDRIANPSKSPAPTPTPTPTPTASTTSPTTPTGMDIFPARI